MNKIIKVFFLSQILANELHELQIKHAGIGRLKSKLKNLKFELIRLSEQHYDKFDDKAEEQTDLINDVTDEFISFVSNVPIEHYTELQAIYKAYRKDPKSIIGISKKII